MQRRIVAAILHNEDRVLLCHRHPSREWYPDVWDLPGGHVEEGEESGDALVRELGEELAVVLKKPIGEHRFHVVDSEFDLTVWLIDYAGNLVNNAPEEHDELRWVKHAEIAELKLADNRYLAMFSDVFDDRRRFHQGAPRRRPSSRVASTSVRRTRSS